MDKRIAVVVLAAASLLESMSESIPMRNLMKRIRFFVYVTALISVTTPSAPADKQLFSLNVAAPGETLKTGAELRLHVTVTNTSDRAIAFIRSPGLVPEEGLRYEIEVRDAKGQVARPSAYVRRLQNETAATFESRLHAG